MADPSLPLQAALYARLVANTAVGAAAAGGVYDRYDAARYPGPYLIIGEGQVAPDVGDCLDGAEVWLTLHAWAEGEGMPPVKRIAGAVVAALADAAETLPVAGYDLLDFRHDGTRYLHDRKPDTVHAVITFRVLVEAT